jgi:glutamyl-tRNA reductase
MSGSACSMPLALVGCDFRVAPSSLRSRLVLPPEKAAALAAGLASPGAADGLVVLETCNRNEWIVATADPEWATELLAAQMRSALGDDAAGVTPYRLAGEAAARHVLRVVLGLESLVVGERQIAGQLFQAFQTAREQHRSGRLLRLAEREGHAACNGRGVHTLALDYLRHHLDTLQSRIVVIGIGAIGRRVLAAAHMNGRTSAVACNRTPTATCSGAARPLAELPELLATCDAAVVCTGAPRPVVRASALAATPRRAPLLVIDIGIPEQVERTGVPVDVTVVGLDELAAFHRSQHTGATLDEARLDQLVEETIGELAWFCSVPDYAGILETLVHRSRPVLHERIAQLVAALPAGVTPQQRHELERDIRGVVQDYTNDVLASVKESGRGRLGERP